MKVVADRRTFGGRLSRVLILSSATAGVIAACGVPAPDTSGGKAIAERWCAECHRISVDQPSGSRAGHVLPPPVDAPSFMAIASRPGIDAGKLHRFMAELHLPMPTYRLSVEEQDQVIRYILSLKSA